MECVIADFNAPFTILSKYINHKRARCLWSTYSFSGNKTFSNFEKIFRMWNFKWLSIEMHFEYQYLGFSEFEYDSTDSHIYFFFVDADSSYIKTGE